MNNIQTEVNPQDDLLTAAAEKDRARGLRDRYGRAEIAIKVGLVLSAVISIIGVTWAVYQSFVDPAAAVRMASQVAGALAFFVAIASVVPAEIALFAWGERLMTYQDITGGQRAIAVLGMAIAAVASVATTTAAFITWLPGWFGFLAQSQSYFTIAAIVLGWIGLLGCIIAYIALDRASKNNAARAGARNRLQDAQNDTLRAIAESMDREMSALVKRLNAENYFEAFARQAMSNMLGVVIDQAAGALPAGSSAAPTPTPTAAPAGDLARLLRLLEETETDDQFFDLLHNEHRAIHALTPDDYETWHREMSRRHDLIATNGRLDDFGTMQPDARAAERDRLQRIAEGLRNANPTTAPAVNGHGREG